MEFKQQIGNLVEAYVAIKDDLSHDDHDGAQNKLGVLRGALESIDMSLTSGDAHVAWMERLGELKAGVDTLGGAADLESSRASFERVSNALVDTVRQFGSHGEVPVLLYNCPMSFDGRGADWLQTKEGTENPYYGSKMFKCGSLKETLVPLSGDKNTEHEGHGHE